MARQQGMEISQTFFDPLKGNLDKKMPIEEN
jgi:hypothetical protein